MWLRFFILLVKRGSRIHIQKVQYIALTDSRHPPKPMARATTEHKMKKRMLRKTFFPCDEAVMDFIN